MDAQTPKYGRMRRVLRWAVWGGALLGIALVILVNRLLYSERFAAWLLEEAMPVVNEKVLPGEVRFSGFSGSLGTSIRLENVEIDDELGLPAVRAKTLTLQWDVLDLLGARVDIHRLHLEEPRVWVRVREEGGVNFVGAFVKPKDPDAPAKEKKKRDGPVKLPVTLDVRDLQLDDGYVEVILGNNPPVVLVDDVQARLVWSMRDLNQDFTITRLDADLKKPVRPGPLSISGSGTLATTDLTVDDLAVDWGDDRVVISGAWPKVGRGVADLDVAIERLDLEHLKAFAEAIPLRQVVSGALELDGALSDLHAKGDLAVEGGGALAIADLGVRIQSGTPLGHSVDVVADAFPLGDVVTVEALPKVLSGHIVWNGEGTNLQSLKGEAEVDLAGFPYRQFHVEPTVLRAAIDGPVITIDRLDTGTDGVLLSTAGTVDLEAGEFELDTDARVADIGLLGRALRAPLETGRVRLQGRQKGSWKTPGATFALTTDSTVEGNVLALGGLAFDGIVGDWRLDLALRPEAAPSVNGDVRFTATKMSLGGIEIDEVQVRADGTDAAAMYEIEATDGDDRSLAHNGRVVWRDMPRLRVDADRLLLTWDGETIDGGRTRVTVDSGRVEATPAVFDLSPGRLEAGGVWDPKQGSDLDLVVEGVDLVRLQRFLPESVGLAGTLERLAAAFDGTLEAPNLKLATRVKDLRAAGRGAFDVDLALATDPTALQGHVHVADFVQVEIERIPARLNLAGGQPLTFLPDDAWSVTTTLPAKPLSEWTDRLAVPLPGLVEGGVVRGRVDLAGTTAQPAVDSDLDLSELSLGSRSLHLSAGVVLEQGKLAFRDTHLRDASAGTVFSLTAEADTALGDQLLARFGPEPITAAPLLAEVQLEGGFRRLPLDILHALVPALKPLQGAVKGRVALGGRLSAPEVLVDLSLLGATLGKRSLQTAAVTLGVKNDRLDGKLEIAPEGGGILRIVPRATVPLVLDGSRSVREMFGIEDSLLATVEGNGFPIEVPLAFVPGILEADGAIEIGGEVTGSLMDPKPKVDVLLDPARVCWSRTSICYEDISLKADLDPSRLRMTSFDFDTLPILSNPLDAAFRPVDSERAGGLEGRGRIDLDGWRLGEVDVHLTGEKTWLMYSPEIQLLVDAQIDANGPFPDLDITGAVDVRDLKVDMGSQDVQRSVQPMVLPEELRVHRSSTKRRKGEREIVVVEVAPEGPPEPTLLERLNVDVAIDLGVNNRVKLAYGVGEALAQGADDQAGKTVARSIDLIGKIEPDVRPKGAVQVQLREGKLRLLGDIGVQRNSKLKVLTAKFDLDTESNVNFGGELADAALDLRAVHTSRYGEIAVVVGGALTAPTISFESDAFDSQADMLAVLIAGRPLSDHSAAEGNATARAVSGALSGFTTKLLDKVVPLDIFQLDLGDDASSGSVEAGKAIGPRLVVITRWAWGGEDDENRVEAEVEVLLARGLYFKTRMGDRIEGSVDVVYKQRF